MGRRALVIGGTGPTGIWIVQGLLDRGWDAELELVSMPYDLAVPARPGRNGATLGP